MFSSESILKQRHLEIYILGLEEMASQPMRKRFFQEPDADFHGAQSIHNARETYYNHMLKAVQNKTENGKKALPYDVVDAIADHLYSYAKAELGIEPGKPEVPGSKEHFNAIGYAIGQSLVCFEECIALHEKKEDVFISFLHNRLLQEEHELSPWVIGRNYLMKHAEVERMDPKNPRRIFRQTEANVMLECFERKIAGMHPNLGQHQLRHKCEKELQIIARETNLPIPGRDFPPM
jgi:hypothetical protein